MSITFPIANGIAIVTLLDITSSPTAAAIWYLSGPINENNRFKLSEVVLLVWITFNFFSVHRIGLWWRWLRSMLFPTWIQLERPLIWTNRFLDKKCETDLHFTIHEMTIWLKRKFEIIYQVNFAPNNLKIHFLIILCRIGANSL